jgi:hypothetical protein
MTTGAEHGEIADAGSPVIIPDDPVDARAPLRWTTLTVAIATGLLALGNVPVAAAWLEALPPGPFVERLRPMVAEWTRVTKPFTGLHAGMSVRWEQGHTLRFGHEQPGEPGATEAP